ncbi:MAG: nucleotide exchange factor GrpE [Verrucomicrobiota bacterium]|jgi:molecular chaperone GrpE (heat shock protein)
MNDATNWKVPKWPFLLGDALLMVFGYFFVLHSPLPIRHWEIAAGCVAIGAILGVIPFILDYRATGRALEVNALGAVAEKIQNLEKLAAQISSATNQWASVQESVQGNSDKTVGATKEIADRMAEEIRLFSEFMKKTNDSEKATLRLEVEKLRRGELEWLQVLVHILDHVFVLHTAAMRSGDVKFAAPITTFQNACRDLAHRLGLTSFAAEPGEPFDAERHQVAGSKETPPAGAVVAETIGSGYTFQGRLLRPALVRLRDGKAPAETQPQKPASTASPAPGNAGGGFSLESPE